jgi:hypothetical protein
MKTAWIALAMVVACGALADSNPPTLTPTKPAQVNQSGTSNTGQPSGKTDNPAAPTVQIQFNGALNQQKSDDKTKEGNQNPPIDWWGRIITALTLVAIAFQAWIYLRQRDLMGRQADIMGHAASSADSEAKRQSKRTRQSR